MNSFCFAFLPLVDFLPTLSPCWEILLSHCVAVFFLGYVCLHIYACISVYVCLDGPRRSFAVGSQPRLSERASLEASYSSFPAWSVSQAFSCPVWFSRSVQRDDLLVKCPGVFIYLFPLSPPLCVYIHRNVGYLFTDSGGCFSCRRSWGVGDQEELFALRRFMDFRMGLIEEYVSLSNLFGMTIMYVLRDLFSSPHISLFSSSACSYV